MTADRDPGFDRVAATLDPAMVVVEATSGGERSGCLVGFHCQCSIDPPRYAVWLSRANHTFPVASAAERLTIHLLSADDHLLAAVFGTLTGDEVDKWEALDAAGLALDGGRIEGRIVARLDDGVCDHVAFVVEPDATGPAPEGAGPLRLSMVADLHAGHEA